MGKKILKLLLYLMAVVGVLIWLDSTVGLTEEGALIIFGIALLAYFVMKLIGFLVKRRRIRRERAPQCGASFFANQRERCKTRNFA